MEEREPHRGVAGDDRRGSRPESRRDGPLLSGCDIERRECEPGTVLGERTCCRRKPLLLRECLVERAHALPDELRALGEGRPLALGIAGRLCSLDGLTLDRGDVARRPGLVLGRRLAAEALQERAHGLRPQLEALDPPLQPIPGRHCSLAAPGRVGELLLGARTIGEQAFESPLRTAPRERGGVAAPLGLGSARLGVVEVELRDPRLDACDLDRELLRSLGRRRLERKRPQALAHLLLDVSRTLDLQRDPRELQLCAVPAPLELPEPGGFLHECPAVLRLRREHLLDLPLTDDGVHRSAETDVGEDLHQVDAANGSAVDQVLTLAATHEPARNRDLGEVELGPGAVLVVEDELHLAVLRRLTIATAGKEDVVGLLGPQLRRRQRARRPDDCVAEVRLARAIRADDDGDARLERDLDGVRERLEAADAERAQVHRA